MTSNNMFGDYEHLLKSYTPVADMKPTVMNEKDLICIYNQFE